ncbi:hypothetical protein M422DRAFT_225771 [Sphaerobolus stellatus SS14]|nr:hypothetical protein M422DRAFT_225771 [Sphaerobolus stellatus SS14]
MSLLTLILQEDSQWVRIRSTGGFDFLITRKAARCSGFLREMLDSQFAEAMSNTVSLELRPVVAEKILEYLVFKAQYEKASAREDIPDFGERIVPELALETCVSSFLCYLSAHSFMFD